METDTTPQDAAGGGDRVAEPALHRSVDRGGVSPAGDADRESLREIEHVAAIVGYEWTDSHWHRHSRSVTRSLAADAA